MSSRVAEILAELEEIRKRFRRVKVGDIVEPDDHNALVDFDEKLLELASLLTFGGVPDPWVPILDLGKLDHMIVGEPRRFLMAVKTPHLYLELKPIYGYLHEDDIRAWARTINALLGKNLAPMLSFGDTITAETFNYFIDLIDQIAKASSLPHRALAVGSDVYPRYALVMQKVRVTTDRVVANTFTISVRVYVK